MSVSVRIRNWAAWSPGLENRESWQAWQRQPQPLASEGVPAADFLPAALRRRCTRLTKMMLCAAFDCCDDETRSHARTVFASRHGAIHVAVKILATIAREDTVSPMQFSHSVHNAQAGLFSIAAGNREASSSLAAEEDTFAHGFLEALLSLERAPRTPVLLVTGDEPIPDNLRHLVDEAPGAYGIAFLIESANPGAPGTLEFALGKPAQAGPAHDVLAWPQAAEFLRWLASDEASLTLGRRCTFTWQRAA